MNASQAVRRAVGLVNAGEALGLPEWALIVRACQTALVEHGEADAAVEFAAAVGRQVDHGHLLDSSAPCVVAEAVAGASEPTPGQLRTVVAMATHAARRGELPGAWAGLLAGVERAALQPGSPGKVTSLEVALHRWPTVVAASVSRAAVSPQLLAAVGHQQIGLLAVARDLVSRMPPDQAAIDTAGLGESLDACRAGWLRAVNGWKSAASGPAVSGLDATALSMAAVDLHDALLSRPPTADTLRALLASGVGGNLLVAAAVDPDPASALTGAARHLDVLLTRIADDAPAIDCAAPTRAAATVAAPADVSAGRVAAEMSAGRVAATRPNPVVSPPVVEAVRLTAESERELACRRDAGVVAQAALDGVGEAMALLAGASEAELSRLVWEGRQAVGVLVASVRPALWSRVRRFEGDLDDRFAIAAVEVAAQVHQWDPGRSRWLSWALRVADWTLAGYYARQAGLPKPMQMGVDTDDRYTDAVVDPRLLVSGLPDPAEVTVSALDAARALALVDGLSWPANQILREAMGLHPAGAPASSEAIARRIGVAPNTVRRHLAFGLGRVRTQFGVDV